MTSWASRIPIVWCLSLASEWPQASLAMVSMTRVVLRTTVFRTTRRLLGGHAGDGLADGVEVVEVDVDVVLGEDPHGGGDRATAWSGNSVPAPIPSMFSMPVPWPASSEPVLDLVVFGAGVFGERFGADPQRC